MKRAIFIMLVALSVSACGSRKDLALKPGQAPAPVARGADRSENSGEMTRFEAQARPDRGGEPLYRSEERREDPFDLPPS